MRTIEQTKKEKEKEDEEVKIKINHFQIKGANLNSANGLNRLDLLKLGVKLRDRLCLIVEGHQTLLYSLKQNSKERTQGLTKTRNECTE